MRPDLRAPHNRHDFVFVRDVARAIADVIEQPPPETVYNVGSGRSTAVADVVAAVERLVGRRATLSPPPGSPEQDFWADISRLQHDTGWRPVVDLEAGLHEMLSVPAGAG